MRDNLFHASTAESIGSRHAETYLRKMRSANAGGANATTAGLNSPIPEERAIPPFDPAGPLSDSPRGFLLPTERPRYFILLTGTRGGGERQWWRWQRRRWRRLPSPKQRTVQFVA